MVIVFLINAASRKGIWSGSKFSISGGKITYTIQDLVGEGLKENYDNIAKSFNESQGGNYKGLIEGALNSLPDRYQSDIITVDGNNNVTGGDFNTFSAYYLDTKVPKFSASDAAQPPMGFFLIPTIMQQQAMAKPD